MSKYRPNISFLLWAKTFNLERLQYHCMRMSNNHTMQFTDEEVLTVYLFCTAVEQRFTIKGIHIFAKEYPCDWFPRLPTYQTFNARLNRMNSALRELSEDLFSSFQPEDIDRRNSIIDNMPIMLCTGRNKQGKVAPEVANKGYCATSCGHLSRKSRASNRASV